MILRGISDILVHTSGGLGFEAFDPYRPDKGPARPGYFWVSSTAIHPPPPPTFVSVESELGVLTVVLSCPEEVDGYQVGISTSSVIPPSTWGSTTSDTYTAASPTGSWYVFARAVRGGMVSSWSVWGAENPGEDEWRLVYEDQSISNTSKVEYGNITEDTGSAVIYAAGSAPYDSLNNNNWGAVGDDPTLGRFTSFAVGEHGARYKFKFRDGATSAYTRIVGVLFACAGSGADCYVMAVCCGTGTYTPYMRLYKRVSGSLTFITEAEITSAGYTEEASGGFATAKVFELDFQARDNEFRGYSNGALYINTTDNSIPWSASTTYAGLYFDTEPWSSITSAGIFDYLEVYARDNAGLPIVVDPGLAVDSLREGVLDGPFNLSHYVRWCSGNADADYLHLRMDDSDPKKLTVDLYNPYTAASADSTFTVVRGDGTANRLLKWSDAAGSAADTIISDDGTTVSWTGRLSVSDDDASIVVAQFTASGASAVAVEGIASGTGYGLKGSSTDEAGLPVLASQGGTLADDCAKPAMRVHRCGTLSGYDYTAGALEILDETTASGVFLDCQKYSEGEVATRSLFQIFHAGDGLTAGLRMTGFDDNAELWRYWEIATADASMLVVNYEDGASNLLEIDGEDESLFFAGSYHLGEIAALSTGVSGRAQLWADSTDHLLHYLDSTGTAHKIWTDACDGEDSGLDADTVDGLHADELGGSGAHDHGTGTDNYLTKFDSGASGTIKNSAIKEASGLVEWEGWLALKHVDVPSDKAGFGQIWVYSGNSYPYFTITSGEDYTLALGNGTANTLAKWSSSGPFLGDSGITDDGTTVAFDRDLEMASDNAVYLGDSGTDGTWKIVRADNDLVFYRRESGTYTEKDRVTA